MKKHFPEEWTDKNGKKQLTCICGNDLPCKEEGHETLEMLNQLPTMVIRDNRLYSLNITRCRHNDKLTWNIQYITDKGGYFQRSHSILIMAIFAIMEDLK